jgi:membrane fusion protein (multidrug efflux system)
MTRRFTHRFRLALALFLLVPSLAAGAQPPKPGTKPAGVPVKAVQARTGTVTAEVAAVGTLLANETVVIRPEIAGRVTAIHFNEGEAVAAGARLVALDAAEIRAQLEASRADERLSAQRAQRAGELFSKNFISRQALDDAREAHKKAAAKRREDEARLARTDIRAPFAGIVGLRQVSAGAYLRAGEDIVRLDKVDLLKLDFRVPEVFLGRLRKEQPVLLRVDAFPAEQFAGRVYALETTVDEKTRTVLLRARVANPGGKLKPGMFARVTLELGSRSDAVMVPEQALVPRGDKNFVFKVIDGKAALTEVATGSRMPGAVEITRGVAAGERIVTDGQMKLQNGTPVMVLPEKPAAAKPEAKGG